jgi:hypothetical protein
MSPLAAICSETLVIVIDGLDECAPSNGIRLLSTLVDCLASFRIKLLVSSRGDEDIASRFALIPHKPVLLQEQPLEEVEKDVRLYWERSLDGLCPPRGDADWRHSVSLDRLADLTGHLFIYAATILKIVQNFKHNRVEELTKLLETSNNSLETDKRSVLNDLYIGILSRAVSNYDGTVNPRSVHHLRDILEVVTFARYPLTSRALVQLLDIETDVLNGYLATLISVLIIPDTNSADGVIRPLHQSFPDFVCQYSGSVHHDLAIDTAIANGNLTKHCLARLNKELHFDMCNIQDPSLFNNEVEDLEGRLRTHVPLALRYSCEFWPVHCLSGMSSTDLQSQVLLGLVDLCRNHLLHWIEMLSLIDGLNVISRDIPKLLGAFEVTLAISSQYCERLTPCSLLQSRIDQESCDVRPWLVDTLFLMKAYMIPISLSALHVYNSGLVGMPWCTLSTGVSHPLVGRLVSQRDHQWSAGPMLLEGHTDWISSVAFSPDNLQITSGSWDNTVRVWDAVSGAHKHTLEGHTNWIFSVAFSPNSSQIISGSRDHTVRVWDAVSGAHKHTLTGHTEDVDSVAFSPNGAQIISGSGDHTVRLWDAAMLDMPYSSFAGGKNSRSASECSSDRSQAASESQGQSVRVRNIGCNHESEQH